MVAADSKTERSNRSFPAANFFVIFEFSFWYRVVFLSFSAKKSLLSCLNCRSINCRRTGKDTLKIIDFNRRVVFRFQFTFLKSKGTF